jgi:peptidyl-prolyl cis-trans isomerase SurA
VIRTRHRRRPGIAVVVAVASLFLTGCGSSVGIHPGAAIFVGEQTLSMNKVDDTATLYCRAYVTQSQQSQQGQSGPIPMGTFRSYVASSLAKRLVGKELADQYAVQPAPGYQSAVSQIDQALASTPADERNAVVDVATADAYLRNVQVAIGQQLTGNEGLSNSDVKAAQERGAVATEEWLNDHDVKIDPVYGVAVDGGAFTPHRDQTSYPLSALASAGAQTNGQQGPPAAYTSALPVAQVCS